VLIIAASGAGKSFFIKSPRNRGQYKDADHVPQVADVYKRLTRDYGHEWWERPDYDEIRPLKQALLNPVLTRLAHDPDHFYLTAEGPPLNGREIVHWYVPADLLFERSILRREKQIAQAGRGTQPLYTVEKARGVVAHYLDEAQERGWTVAWSNPLWRP